MSLTRLGLPLAPADSNNGLTKCMYNVLKVSIFKYLTVFFIEARTQSDFLKQVAIFFVI